MATYNAQWVTTFDSGEWRPRSWTIACVGTVHLFFAAAVLTAVPPPLEKPPINVVEIVTIPNDFELGAATPPVETVAPDETPAPSPVINPKFGPKPSDRREVPEKAPIVEREVAPTPPEVSPPKAVEPIPVPVPVTPPPPVPQPKASVVPSPPAPAPKAAPTPVQVPMPTVAPNPEPVTVRPPTPTPVSAQPVAPPREIVVKKLELKRAAPLKPNQTLTLPRTQIPAPLPAPAPAPAPAAPTPVPAAAPAAPTQVKRTPSPPPPFAAPAPTPLSVTRPQTTLPKVQLPRIRALDLRVPEAQSSPIAAQQAPPSPPASVSGVTSIQPPSPSAGAIGGPAARPNGASGQSGSTGGGSPGSAGGSTAGGAPATGAAGGAASGGTAGPSGPTGILPRRPGGRNVPQPFPRGDSNTLLGKMDKTYDCSRVNRERDARCPDWSPIEGRNGRAASQFEVPEPKGLPKLRNPIGTNPLPPCPPGTAGNQMGLSCLPTREGPGIPKP